DVFTKTSLEIRQGSFPVDLVIIHEVGGRFVDRQASHARADRHAALEIPLPEPEQALGVGLALTARALPTRPTGPGVLDPPEFRSLLPIDAAHDSCRGPGVRCSARDCAQSVRR